MKAREEKEFIKSIKSYQQYADTNFENKAIKKRALQYLTCRTKAGTKELIREYEQRKERDKLIERIIDKLIEFSSKLRQEESKINEAIARGVYEETIIERNKLEQARKTYETEQNLYWYADKLDKVKEDYNIVCQKVNEINSNIEKIKNTILEDIKNGIHEEYVRYSDYDINQDQNAGYMKRLNDCRT